MSLQHLSLTAITESDLARLRVEKVRESRAIDFKRDWKLKTDDDRREFLADVTSFANSGGGDLVYGVAEKEGVAEAIVGLDGFAQDTEQLRVEQLIARWIAPRLAGVGFGSVPLANGKVVFIVRVARSGSGPHQVTFNDYNKFFSRHSSGKYQMNVDELREAFLQTERGADRIREFRQRRVNQIAAGNTGIKLWANTCVVLHLIPITPPTGLDPRNLIDLRVPFRPMGQIAGYSHQMTEDGFMNYASVGDHVAQSYVQMFRSGAIEAVLADPTMEKMKRIQPAYEGTVRRALRSFIPVYRMMGVNPPFMLALSLVNVAGFSMAVRDDGLPFRQPSRPIEGPNVQLEEVTFDLEPASVDTVLKPLFDRVWNSCGYFGSANYDAQGQWREGAYEM